MNIRECFAEVNPFNTQHIDQEEAQAILREQEEAAKREDMQRDILASMLKEIAMAIPKENVKATIKNFVLDTQTYLSLFGEMISEYKSMIKGLTSKGLEDLYSELLAQALFNTELKNQHVINMQVLARDIQESVIGSFELNPEIKAKIAGIISKNVFKMVKVTLGMTPKMILKGMKEGVDQMESSLEEVKSELAESIQAASMLKKPEDMWNVSSICDFCAAHPKEMDKYADRLYRLMWIDGIVSTFKR